MDDILAEARKVPEVMNHLPEKQKEIEKLPKQFLINVAYKVVGTQFADWVKDRIVQRNSKITSER